MSPEPVICDLDTLTVGITGSGVTRTVTLPRHPPIVVWQSFAECTEARLRNRLLCASARSVCVTWLPALISSQGRYA